MKYLFLVSAGVLMIMWAIEYVQNGTNATNFVASAALNYAIYVNFRCEELEKKLK